MCGALAAAGGRISYQLGLLRIDRVTELQQSLELVVLGESDYLHDGAKLGEDLHTPRNQRERLRPEHRGGRGAGWSVGATCCSTSRVTG